MTRDRHIVVFRDRDPDFHIGDEIEVDGLRCFVSEKNPTRRLYILESVTDRPSWRGEPIALWPAITLLAGICVLFGLLAVITWRAFPPVQ